MHAWRAYRDLLRDRSWVRPLVASLVGRLPESMIAVALVLLVHQSTGSYVSAGLVTGGFALGSAFAGPVAGRALDRFGRRIVLLSLALTFAVVLVVLVLSARHVAIAVTVMLASLTGVSRPPLEAAMRGLWASIVAAPQLQAAYLLDAIGQDVIWVGGPLLLSVLLLMGGPSSALLACAACSAVGTIAYTATPVHGPPAADSAAVRRAPLRSPALTSLLAATGLYGVAMGAFEVALSAFCVEHDAKPAVGVLLAVWSLGSILGGVLYGARTWSAHPARRAGVLLGAIAILLAVLNLAAGVLTLALLLFVMGLPTAPFTGSLNAAVQRLAPAARCNEGFTWATSMITIGIATGNAAAGPLAQSHRHLGFAFAAVAAASGAMLGLTGPAPPASAAAEAYTAGGSTPHQGGSDPA